MRDRPDSSPVVAGKLAGYGIRSRWEGTGALASHDQIVSYANDMTAANCTRCGQPAESHPQTRPQRELAERVMTARWDNTICPRCQMTIRRGDRIGQVDGKWLHVECVTGRKPPMIGWPSAA
jgi:endogenous inhibitor of DNA gyrase (YacG/DUF329 family)